MPPAPSGAAVSDAVREVKGEEKTVGPWSSAARPAASRQGSCRSQGVRFSVHTASRGSAPYVHPGLRSKPSAVQLHSVRALMQQSQALLGCKTR